MTLRGYAKIALGSLKQVQGLPPIKKDPYKGSALMNYIWQTMQKYPDAVVITQIGGFYELYYEHALEYGPKLALKVAQKRQYNPITRQEFIPMTGFPSSQISKYSQMLVQNWGKNVVVLSQSMEQILLKAPEHLKRPVERILTPGTLIEQDCVDISSHNYIVAVNSDSARVSLAWVDMNEGSIYYETSAQSNLSDILSRINPREVVLDNSQRNAAPEGYYTSFTAFPPREMFLNYRSMYSQSHSSAVMMADNMGPLAQGAVAALLAFLQQAYPNSHFKYQPPRPFENDNHMIIDAASRESLELFKAQQRDSMLGSVCSIMDHTLTTSGSRLLKDWISRPLQRSEEIERRLDLVTAFRFPELATLRDELRQYFDIKSITQKLGLAPRAEAIHSWINSVSVMDQICEKLPNTNLFSDWKLTLKHALAEIQPALSSVQTSLKPIQTESNLDRFIPRRFECLINPGVCGRMDKLLSQRTKLVAAYDKLALTHPGEPRYSPNQGYYFFLKSDISHLAPEHHRVVSSTRTSVSYTTDELAKWAGAYEQNTSSLDQRQAALLSQMRDELLSVAIPARAAAGILDELDVIQSFATLASKHNLVRPEFGAGYKITNGWSLAVEQGLLSERKEFTRNDCELGTEKSRICMLSGPNMGGKSTYLRQVALISVMAQAGSFVPAERAIVPIIDRVFCRMGSGDNVTRGRSTFMVEMLETALILRLATPSSLAILDEVGRGTSERDGVAIAFASIKHMIEKNQCFAVFSTHYAQEISSALKEAGLSQKVEYLKTSPKFISKHIEYNYRLEKGINEAAHGIEMAKMAGFPKRSLAKAIKAYTEGHINT